MISQKAELTTDISKMLILGSGSAARKELLSSVGLIPDKIEIPNVDESKQVDLLESFRHSEWEVLGADVNELTEERDCCVGRDFNII